METNHLAFLISRLLVLLLLHVSSCGGEPTCNDFLMPDVCRSYYSFGQCHLYQAQRDCRKTCKVCGDGWSAWSSWRLCSAECDGTQTRTRICRSRPSHCPGDDYESRTCKRPGAKCGDEEEEGEEEGEGEGEEEKEEILEKLVEYICSKTTFRCDPKSDVCLENELICDGYKDCPNGFDEVLSSCELATYSNSSFQIKNELMQVCMEVVTDDPEGPINGVRGYRRCPSDLSPQKQKYMWRWWKSFHLINLKTGKCLTADDPRKSSEVSLRIEPCNSAMSGQQWMCDNNTDSLLLLRLRDVKDNNTDRFLNLGEDKSGWPVVFSTNSTDMKSMWHKGPKEPPESICHELQVHWSDWSAWSMCTLTCKGGRRSHTRFCVNGKDGVPPCEGTKLDTESCNGDVSCEKVAGKDRNSNCRADYHTHEHDMRFSSGKILDPSCYKIYRTPMNYEDAKKTCHKHRSFLASVKTEKTLNFLIELMKNFSVSPHVYIGIEENFTQPIVQGHHLRFSMDQSPVGDLAPWHTDCVLGEGFSYVGKLDKASILKSKSTLQCQTWSSMTPHAVKFKPQESSHSFCRNPNLDPLGPWCYTLDAGVEHAYCDLPQCQELISPTKLSDEAQFRIVRDIKGFIYDPYTKDGHSEVDDNIDGKQCLSAGGIKRHGPTGDPAEKWLMLSSCKKGRTIPEDQSFVWDISRRRILHSKSLMCIAALNSKIGAMVILQTCNVEKATQRWRSEDNRLVLDYPEFDQELHLDVDAIGRKLIVTSLRLRLWSASRARGYTVDWSGLRKAYGDESFELYNYPNKKCIGLDIDGKVGDKSHTLYVGDSAPLAFLPCHATPRFKWMRFPPLPNMILHVQTSLCLTSAGSSDGSQVMLKKCTMGDKSQQWSCTGEGGVRLSLQSDPSYHITGANESVVISSSPSNFSIWIAWGSKNRTVCQFEVATGDVGVGSKFAIRNNFRSLCVRLDKVGSLYTKPCEPKGNISDEVWRFTRSPTMIRHIDTGKCIRSASILPGSPILAYQCSTHDIMQHWTVFSTALHMNPEGEKYYFGLHPILNPTITLSLDAVTSRLFLQDNTAAHWLSYTPNYSQMPLTSMADCTVHTETSIVYAGTVSVTNKGHRCLPWSETRFALFDMEKNYCRNRGKPNSEPWCFVNNERGLQMKEDCGIPACPTVKVKMDTEGKWMPTTGKEKLPFICQAEPECYRNIGTDYIGSWNATAKGICALWKDHKESGFERNFCRNPNSVKSGPWCYTHKTKADKETCPIPKCTKNCGRIPDELFQGEIIQHKYSASVYGSEVESKATMQCHKGFWVDRDEYRSESQCVGAKWQPEPAPCRVITCSTLGRTVKGAVLSTSSSSLYNQYTYFVCNPRLLAGPGKARVSFRCDESGQWEESENQEKSCTRSCEIGWTEFREHCYKTEINERLNFTNAIKACAKLGGTLVDVDDKIGYEFLENLILKTEGRSKDTSYWMGIRNMLEKKRRTDPTERLYKSINYLGKGKEAEKRGVGHLPMLYYSFKIMNAVPTDDFQDILPYDSRRCLFGYEHQKYLVSRSCIDFMHRRMLWTWITPYHLYHVGTKKCLTGFPVNGDSEEDKKESATLEKCDLYNKNQYIRCRRHGPASLKLKFNEYSFFVDDTRPQRWDKVMMGGSHWGGDKSKWMMREDELDVCHWSVTKKGNAFLLWEGVQAEGQSYTYSEAQRKCEKWGGKLATREQVTRKMETEDISACKCAWIDGNQKVTVNRQASKGCESASSPGVKDCSSSKADVFCFRGEERDALDIPWALILLLENITWSGMAERTMEEPHKYICKKEARWHCPPPPTIPRGTILESIATSYSYMGYTTYTCDPGYWFERGVFSKIVRCTEDLQWDPDPADLVCEPLDCPPPAEISHANRTIYSLDIHGKAYYKCHYGYQFRYALFDMEVVCSANAYWFPSPNSYQCLAVRCNPPPAVEFATHLTYSLSYPYNTTYSCDKGYWFGPGLYERNSMCDGDATWKPNPNYLRCWIIVCLATSYHPHAILDRVAIKMLDMKCEHGYQLVHVDNGPVDGSNITFICEDDGQWKPDPEKYQCQMLTCSQPPLIKLATHNTDHRISTFKPGSGVMYHCRPGNYLNQSFSLFTPMKKMCMFEGENRTLIASKEACGTTTALYFYWHTEFLLQEVNSGLCMASYEIPTEANPWQKVVLKECNESDITQQWHCNFLGISDLLLGVRSSITTFLTIDNQSKKVHVSEQSFLWMEWIIYSERDAIYEQDICHYKKRAFHQSTWCYVHEEKTQWMPDPEKAVKCLPIHCSTPPTIEFGSYEVLSDTDQPVSVYSPPYSSAVRYTCDEGYEFLPNRTSFVSRCTDLSLWAPDPLGLPCRRIRCPIYKVPYHALIKNGSLDNYQYTDEFEVECPNGWMFRPGIYSLTAKCNADAEWESSVPAERCVELACDPPPKVENATLNSTDDFRYNAIVRYTCNDGSWFYPGLNWKESRCKRNGFWAPDPSKFKCIEATCTEPRKVAHTARDGAVAGPDDRYPFGSMIYLKCSKARRFSKGIRKLVITCRDDALWHPDPNQLECHEIGCGDPSPIPRHSYFVGMDYGMGSKVSVQCKKGYRVGSNDPESDNSTDITCLPTMKWDPKPGSITCEPITCGEPPAVANSVLLESNFFYNSYAQVLCEVGFWIRPGMLLALSKCSEDGNWKPDLAAFSCKVVDCGHPGTFGNAFAATLASGGKTTYGSMASIKCRDGFWIAGLFLSEITMNCGSEGLWIPAPEKIHCVVVKCPDPGIISRTSRRAANTPEYHIASQQQDKETGGRFYTYGTQLTYTCDEGLQFAPAQTYVTTICQDWGQWSIGINGLSCQEIICEPPPGILYGKVIENKAGTASGYGEGSSITYKCNQGYWFSRNKFTLKITCMPNSRWNVDVSKIACIRLTCNEPPDIEGTTHVSTGLTATDITNYACKRAHRIQPTNSIFCSEKGFWEPDPTTIKCLPPDCGKIPSLYMAIANHNKTSNLMGTTVHYKCAPGHYFRPGFTTISVTCGQDGKWTNSTMKCLFLWEFECPFPPYIKHADIIEWGVRSVLYKCANGYKLVGSEPEFKRVFNVTCDLKDTWQVDSSMKCEEVTCPKPNITENGEVAGADIKLHHSYSKTLAITCNKGYVIMMKPSRGPITLQTGVVISCTETGQWEPDPTSFKCEELECADPPEIENATLLSNITESKSQHLIYECNGNMSFSRESIQFRTECQADGSWQPDPSHYRCSYFKCDIPISHSHSSVALERLPRDSESIASNLQVIRVSCRTGFWIKDENDTYLFSKMINCSRTGQWNLDPKTVKCIPVTCNAAPNITGTLKSTSNVWPPQPELSIYPYKKTITYSCLEGTWFAPDNVTQRTTECWWDGTWQPRVDLLMCVKIFCPYPPPVNHSLLTSGVTLITDSVWTYKCKDGYRFAPGVYERRITCQANGFWLPDPTVNFECNVIACEPPPPLEYAVNESLLSGNVPLYDYREGSVYTYRCLDGYWISDGSYKSFTAQVTCDKGKWKPEPHKVIRCVMVVCDVPPAMEGARTDGVNHVHNSKVFYQCAKGQHFAYQKTRQLNVTCYPDGKWRPDPHTLRCSDVACKDLDIPGSKKQGDRVDMNAVVIITCPSPTWIERGVTEISTACDEDGRWQPNLDGKKCTLVDCGIPQVNNSLVLESNFTYTKQVKLKCAPGFNMVPVVSSSPVLLCDVSGDWFPDPNEYSCEPIVCTLPRFVPHATMSGEAKFNHTTRVECEPGYFFRRAVNYIDVVCQEDGTWSDDVSNMECVPFQCEAAKHLGNSTRVSVGDISPPNYRSQWKYSCHENYWMEKEIYSVTARCNESGVWDPYMIFECEEIKCKRPPRKANARIAYSSGTLNSSYQLFGTILQYECEPAYWVAVQHAFLEWAFAGIRSVNITCNNKGNWMPNSLSFVCRKISEGPVPIGFGPGLSAQEVDEAGWVNKADLPTENIRTHEYRTAVKSEASSWLYGKSTKFKRYVLESLDGNSENLENIWDDDTNTFWTPPFAESRNYGVVIFLGDLFVVEGFELQSVAMLDVPGSSVENFDLAFSKDGCTFNQSIMSFQVSKQSRSISAPRFMDFPFDVTHNSSRIYSEGKVETLPVYFPKGRMPDNIVVTKAPDSQGIRFEGFSVSSKFIQITVTATKDINQPPIVQEIGIFAAPAKWRIVYPTDFTVLYLVSTILVMFLIIFALALVLDAADRLVVHCGWRIRFKLDNVRFELPSECFFVRFQFSKPKDVNYIVARIVFSNKCTELICIKPQSYWFWTKHHAIALLPAHDCSDNPPLRLDFGFVGSGDTTASTPVEYNSLVNVNEPLTLNAIKFDIKIAEVANDEPIFGKMNWIHAERNVNITPNTPVSIDLQEDKKELKISSTVSRILGLDITSSFFYRCMARHLFSTIFVSDFLTQTGRNERSLILFFGCCFGLATSSICVALDILLEEISCFGIGVIAALATLPAILFLFLLLLRTPVFKSQVCSLQEKDHGATEEERSVITSSTSKEKDDSATGDKFPVGDVLPKLTITSISTIDKEQIPGERGDFKPDEEVVSSETEEEEIDDVNLMNLILKFKNLDDGMPKKFKSATQLQSESLTTLATDNSQLLPSKFRKRAIKLQEEIARELAGITKQQLYLAAKARLERGPIRHTRSCYAIMKYTSPSFKRKVWHSDSMPSMMDDFDEDEVFSCASMWSRDTLVRAWHRVHQSIDVPVQKLFFTDPEPWYWNDPDYRRIPTEAGSSSSGVRHDLSASTLPQWLLDEKRKYDERKAALKLQEKLKIPDEIQIPLRRTGSFGTQYPSSHVLGPAKYRSTGFLAEKHAETQHPSKYFLHKKTGTQFPSDYILNKPVDEEIIIPVKLNELEPAFYTNRVIYKRREKIFTPEQTHRPEEFYLGEFEFPDETFTNLSMLKPSQKPQQQTPGSRTIKVPSGASANVATIHPSTGGFFSQADDYDGDESSEPSSSKISQEESKHSSQTDKMLSSQSGDYIKQSTVDGFEKTDSMEKSATLQVKYSNVSNQVVIAKSLNDLYQVPQGRKLLRITIFTFVFIWAVITVSLGTVTVDISPSYICSNVVVLCFYCLFVLTVEAFLRWFIFKTQDRLSLSYLF